MTIASRRFAGFAVCSLVAALAVPAIAKAPDLIVVDAEVTTSDAGVPAATGFAISDGRFAYVGSSEGARALAGPATRVVDLHGARVLPGLVDAHVHPADTVDLDLCDLKSAAKSLREISAIVAGCMAHYRPAPGAWLVVTQWNFSEGNAPDAEFPTLRAALDKAAPANPVKLIGNDGHHGAFNSAALSLARDAEGHVIGLSKATLAGPFARYRAYVGVDAAGEPSGAVNDKGRVVLGGKVIELNDTAAVLRVADQIPARLNAAGITAFLDAMAYPESFVIYDSLEARGRLSAHASLAQFYDPDSVVRPDGSPDYERMVHDAVMWRDHYARDPLIRADTVKLFADGVLEGNPLAVPPTLPNSPALTPYLQPVFGRDAQGRASFAGRYVDPASAECRAIAGAALSGADIAGFTARNGFHPDQCVPHAGSLQHSREVILEWVRRMHKAGMSVHIHAIGDAAVRTAVDALAAARVGDTGPAMRPDTLAHLQLVHPDDQARIGQMHLFLAMTYAWIYTDKDYDLDVIPFVQRVRSDAYADLHAAGSYYETNAYPAAALQRAGAVLAAGSDAPVDTRDPRPFVNMAGGVLRAHEGTAPLGPADQRLTIAAMIRAYTIDGARALGRDTEFGSITPGKSADFIVLNQDITRVPADRIAQTKVRQTWFAGRQVFDDRNGG